MIKNNKNYIKILNSYTYKAQNIILKLSSLLKTGVHLGTTLKKHCYSLNKIENFIYEKCLVIGRQCNGVNIKKFFKLLNLSASTEAIQPNVGLAGLALVTLIGVGYFGYTYFFPTKKIVEEVINTLLEKAEEVLLPTVDVLVKPVIDTILKPQLIETIGAYNYYNHLWEVSAIPFAILLINVYKFNTYKTISNYTSQVHGNKYKIQIFNLKNFLLNSELEKISKMLYEAPDFLKYCYFINDARLKYWSVITNNKFKINNLRLEEPVHILQCIDYVGDFFRISNIDAYARAASIIQLKKSPSLELVSACAYIISFSNKVF